MKTKLRNAESTKRREYVTEINPDLTSNIINTGRTIPEHQRIGYTQIRLLSHRLKIETGRWSRIARENRQCQCNQSIQNEQHALFECHLTDHIRVPLNVMNNIAFYDAVKTFPTATIGQLCYKVLKFYENLNE